MKNIEYLLSLQRINGLGPLRLKKLLDYYQDPKLAWDASEKELAVLGLPQNVIASITNTCTQFDPGKYYQTIINAKIKVLNLFDEEYPVNLSQIYDPPVVIFYRGQILPVDNLAIAVVGTRKMTAYGSLVTDKFAQGLATAGVTVVSGLARGVDTRAHKAALVARGRTLAVLGGGLLHIFPPENTRLAEDISQNGAIISEFPPDYPSLPGNFPARNRIISGLSKAVLVTEAAQDSGSLITAKSALEQGREVYTVPGPITSEYTKGPASLIKEGAKLVLDPSEIISDLGLDTRRQVLQANRDFKLDADEEKILKLLANETWQIDDICRSLNLSAAIVSASLVKMEIRGLVKSLGAGNYVSILL